MKNKILGHFWNNFGPPGKSLNYLHIAGNDFGVFYHGLESFWT